jgi:hypothetical protein
MVLIPALSADAAITAPAANATVSGTVSLADNGAQSAGCSDLAGLSTYSGNTDMFVDQTTGTAQTTVVTPPAADSGTSTVVNLGKVSSTASTNPETGNWVTDDTGNGTYTVNSAEQAGKSTLGIICGAGTLTNAKETVTVSNTGTLVFGATNATSGGQDTTVNLTATLTDQNGIAPATGQTVSFAFPGQTTVTATTNASGVAATTMALVGPPRSGTLTASYAGTYFTAATKTTAFAVTTDPTTTTLSPTTTIDYGQTANFSATVTSQVPADPALPSGSVQFTANGVPIGTGSVNPSTGVANFSDSALNAASYTIGAIYSGDANYTTSPAATETQVVNLAPTATLVTTSVSPSFFGEAITFTATVTALSPGIDTGFPTGTVTFAATPNGGTSSNIGGAATLTATANPAISTASSTSISLLPAGNSSPYQVVATYNPSTSPTNFAVSASSLSQVINPANTTVGVTSTLPSFSDFGQGVQFTATVNTVAPGQGAPTGSVDFVADANTANAIDIGSVNLNPGSDQSTATSPSIASLTPGLHTITATYTNLDGNYETGTLGTVQQFVAPDASTTTISTVNNANPSVFGQPVQFQATVTLAFTDAGTPTGIVLFYINGSDPPNCASPPTPAFEETLVNGVATTPADSSLAVGNNVISACYASTNADFAASATTDPQYDQVVNSDPTTTVLTSANSPDDSSGPSDYGQPVTFTASVSANAPGSGVPLGSVTFFDGASTLATVALSGDASDTASYTTSALAVGSHAIEAVYNPANVDYLSSQDGLNQTVNQDPTTTSVAQNGQSVQGQAISFSATVTANAPGAGAPTGTMTFEVNGAPILGSPVALVPNVNGSTATSETIAALTPGTYQVEAIYSGDTDFLASNGNTGQIVNQSGTSTALTLSPSGATVTYGTPVSLTAVVTPTGSGTGLPTGTVDFYDGLILLGAEPVSTVGGVQQATLPAALYGQGNHSFGAVYLGEFDYSGSTSASVAQTVAVISTTTALTSSINPAAYSVPVIFTATVTPASNAGPGPGGTVTFSDGSTVLGIVPVALSGGHYTASFTDSALAVGGHSITAAYSGATSYGSSASSALSQTITKDNTVIKAAPLNNATMTATLTSAQGAPQSGQTVSFSTGSTALCTGVTNASGVASCTATGLDDLDLVLSGNYTAAYAGNVSYNGSTVTVENT